MKRRVVLLALTIGFLPVFTGAFEIGFFPGLDELIKRADAIVILRIDRQLDEPSVSPLVTYDCFIYQTLKGPIAPNDTIRLRLMDTRSAFVPPFSAVSTHLVFLTRKRVESEPTEFRTLEFMGSNVRLSPLGHEKALDGKSVGEKIRSLLKRALADNDSERKKEKKFLESLLQ